MGDAAVDNGTGDAGMVRTAMATLMTVVPAVELAMRRPVTLAGGRRWRRRSAASAMASKKWAVTKRRCGRCCGGDNGNDDDGDAGDSGDGDGDGDDAVDDAGGVVVVEGPDDAVEDPGGVVVVDAVVEGADDAVDEPGGVVEGAGGVCTGTDAGGECANGRRGSEVVGGEVADDSGRCC